MTFSICILVAQGSHGKGAGLLGLSLDNARPLGVESFVWKTRTKPLRVSW